MKRLHRQIVVSAAYRQSSHSSAPAAWADRPSIPSADAHDVDPENRYGWRMRIGRMEAEAVRDSLLSVAGLLDFRMGGQEIENSEALTTRRRGLYYSCHPEVGGKSVLGELFDAAEPTDCYRRTRSVTPQQALALTNSSLAHEVSGALAERIWLQLEPGQQGEPTAFITAAFEQILTRAPLDKEMTLCRLFLDRQAATIAVKEPATAAARARESLVRALVNHNDFVAIR